MSPKSSMRARETTAPAVQSPQTPLAASTDDDALMRDIEADEWLIHATEELLADLPCALPNYCKLHLSSPPRVVISQISLNTVALTRSVELHVHHNTLCARKRPDIPLVFLGLLRAWDHASVLHDRTKMAHAWNYYDTSLRAVVLAADPIPCGMFAHSFLGIRAGEDAVKKEAEWYRTVSMRKRTHEEMEEELQGKILRTVA
ncbi:hypothetical protein FISHEDRAFT_78902 [Fistulina hepatica ATCC 64428]|uniref:Uncharacterized protein n=1 Tax=Fistulina hepatica ATCC 64428 TaxID=1128425 RepID=A0A0D7A273_9AGAR|nr:hypothetical protein FISHEDRAFT_78902 [Fistulina hepatica ATCC 64428]